MGAGFAMSFSSKDKVSITSAAFSAKVSCSMVGMTTSSGSVYSRPVSSSRLLKELSFSSSCSDSPDGDSQPTPGNMGNEHSNSRHHTVRSVYFDGDRCILVSERCAFGR